MQVRYGRNFRKMYRKLPAPLKQKFGERLDLLLEYGEHPLLNIHFLAGDWRGYKSMNVTGDIRAVFEVVSDAEIAFEAIGSHSQLYS